MSSLVEHYPREVLAQGREALAQEAQLWRQDLSLTRQRFMESLQGEPEPGVLYQTLAKIDEVYYNYHLPDIYRPIEKRDYAFVVHPRDPVDNDIQRQFPAFRPDLMSPEAITEIFESLPPMILGEYNGLKDADGVLVNGWVISAPITVSGLYGNGREGIVAARKKVLDTARFAHERLGVKLIGLGETLGSLSKFGTNIEKDLPELNVTTGHAATVQMVGETLKNGAHAVGIDMKDATLAVVGAAGAIGSSASQLMASEVGHIILHDVGPMVPRLEKVAQSLNGASLEITSDNSALKRADLVISATSSPHPFISREFIKPGTVIVDDSQPVNMTLGEAQAAQALLLHPIAQVPEGVERTFDFSLPYGSDFSCAAEVMALAATREFDQRTIGRLENVEQVKRIAELTKRTGVTAAPMQSFGHLIPESYIEQIRASRNSAS